MAKHTKTLSAGTKVRLGDGREGVVVKNVERAGFVGSVVRITKSIDEAQVGQTVGATTTTMKVIGQTETPETPDVSSIVTKTMGDMIKTQKEMSAKEIPALENQIRQLQERLTVLRQMSAQSAPQQSELEQTTERLEEKDQEELQQRQNIGIQQQVMQQQTQQTQQLQTQQQQQQMKQASRWVKAEKADAKIAMGDAIVLCDVAATPAQQASGLQAYDDLPIDRGLWFPQTVRHATTFHMGEVSFPIDIVFVDDNIVTKIVAFIQPRQNGSWNALCTDVVEVNAGWCRDNNVRVGSKVNTPLNTKNAVSEIERDINRSWSAPQNARIKSTKTYDLMRTLTEAESDDPLADEVLRLFPHLKKAQENRQVKPDMYQMEPGDKDKRNPTDRFRGNDLPDVATPQGEDNPNHDLGESDNMRKQFDYTNGYDIAINEDHPYAVRSSAQVEVKQEHDVNVPKLVQGTLRIYLDNKPEWKDVDDNRGFKELAVVNDNIISTWIDGLGFEKEPEDALRSTMFGDEFKRALGESLISIGEAANFEMFDSDLLLYK